MTTPRITNCENRECRHFTEWVEAPGRPSRGFDAPIPACKAFPGGIPREISYGNNLHLTPFPGDHGIRFEKKEE
jgi:hypothetical protein